MRLVLALILPCACSGAFFLTPRQVERLRSQVYEYFSPEVAADEVVNPLAGVRPELEIFQTVLRAAREAYEPLSRRQSSTMRAEILLRELARKSYAIKSMAGEGLRQKLHEDAQFFLRRFHTGGEGFDAVLEIYDHFQLWRADDLWLFLQIRETPALRKHASRIRTLLPMLSETQLFEFAERLRVMTPKNLFQHVLLLETGHMREAELVQMLGLASMQFARSLDRRDFFDGDQSYVIHALEDPVQRSIALALRRVQTHLHQRDVLVGSAFDKAVTNAKRASQRNYAPENRLLFFKLLQENRLDWQDRSSWLLKAQEISQQNIALRHRYRVEGKVILVQFKAKSECEGKLDN